MGWKKTSRDEKTESWDERLKLRDEKNVLRDGKKTRRDERLKVRDEKKVFRDGRSYWKDSTPFNVGKNSVLQPLNSLRVEPPKLKSLFHVPSKR